MLARDNIADEEYITWKACRGKACMKKPALSQQCWERASNYPSLKVIFPQRTVKSGPT